MLDITIVSFGHLKEPFWQAAAAEYTKRLQPYARLRQEELKAVAFSSGSQEAAKRAEGERLQEYLQKRAGAAIFLMSEQGEELDSPALARRLEKITQPLILVIGGSLGFSPEIAALYPKFSLSRLTFPHELARVILLEQIYRTATILNNKDYHY